LIFAREIALSDNTVQTRQNKIDEYKEKFANSYIAAGLGMIYDVIDPRDTRKSLSQALDMLYNKKEDRPTNKHKNIRYENKIINNVIRTLCMDDVMLYLQCKSFLYCLITS